jgi:CheY-like chemotaxis protein
LKTKKVSIPGLINDLYNEHYNSIQYILQNKTEKVEFIIDTPKEVIINSDASRLKQVLWHLINNALKFTHKGQVKVGYDVEYENNKVKFYVRDTGIGIKKEYYDVIFEKFRKIEEINSDILYRGSGIGLTIAKKILTLMNSDLELESEIGKGSNFFFTINTDIINKEPEFKKFVVKENVYETDLKGKKILIAEDEESNYEYITTLLKNLNVNVKRARNGLEAVEMCKDENYKPDIILMDVKMPVMDGVEATKKIKKMHPDLPIVALTAYILMNEKENILKEGFDGYIAKPFTVRYLVETIQKVI